ncbi:hypothetical protein CEE45_09120 [Candidatus Heimdallarchaeota archaeon B3_Heim]|nr:MAG: hypothetical protein CEE45_09120 [Candidatus Heimdallarchaeota archaeon B3_Heim]
MSNISINLSKQVFLQGELIKVKIRYQNEDIPMKEGKLSFVGTEKVEFNMQSFLGKKGFQPIWGVFLPSRHFTEKIVFLDESYDINHSGGDTDDIEVEIPTNAIPSYYGDNSKVSYFLKVECMNTNNKFIQEEIEILVDRDYQPVQKEATINIEDGTLSLSYSDPLIINAVNVVNITSHNLKMTSPIRFYLTGEETVTASGVTVNNTLKKLPLGQTFAEEDIENFAMEFKIPTKYQHGYEGLQSRVEYNIELHYVDIQTRLGVKREKMKKIDQIAVQVDEMKTHTKRKGANL